LLRHLELRQEQVGGQEPAGPPLATVGGGGDGRGERWLRPAGVRKVHDVQGLGRGGPAQGHALPLSQSAQSPDSIGRGPTCTTEDRGADLYPGDPDQDGGTLHAGRAARTDPRLGGNRSRRLHADLSARALLPSADRSAAAPPRAAAGSFAGWRAPATAISGWCGSSWRVGQRRCERGALALLRAERSELSESKPIAQAYPRLRPARDGRRRRPSVSLRLTAGE